MEMSVLKAQPVYMHSLNVVETSICTAMIYVSADIYHILLFQYDLHQHPKNMLLAY